jgi:iron(III) transport system ATP-binding protein
LTKAGPASVEFRNVSMRYGAVTAVDDVSFAIEAGKLVTLLGPSGCGKTTTLRMIAGLEIASAGQILIGGKDVTRLSAADRDVSMVFQSYALFPHMSVLENAAYGPTVKGLGKDVAREMALSKLALVGLKGFENRYPSELSGGQQQRVAVARALVLEPQVLLFDEPLSNLDAKLRRRVREEIRELQQSLNLTVAYVTIGSASVSLPARGLGPGPARVAVRPESLILSEAMGEGLPGTIRKCTYLGNHLDIIVETEAADLFVVQYGARPMLVEGTPVKLGFANSGVTLIPPG